MTNIPTVIEPAAMEAHPWQRRAKTAGLTQKTLAKLLGHAEITVSRQLRGHWDSGVPEHVQAAIVAWELMTPEMRQAWVQWAEARTKEPPPGDGSRMVVYECWGEPPEGAIDGSEELLSEATRAADRASDERFGRPRPVYQRLDRGPPKKRRRTDETPPEKS